MRICWNSNQTDLLDGGFDENFRLVRDQIGQVHMRDLSLEEYPWRQLLTSLSEMKFAATASRRSPTRPIRSACCKYFRGMFRAYQNL